MDDEANLETEESEPEFVTSAALAMVTDYTISAQRIVQRADDAASTAPGGVMTCEHVLIALVTDDTCAAAQVLQECGFTHARISETILFIGGPPPPQEIVSPVTRSPRVERIFAGAAQEAATRKADRIDTLHLLFALIRERKGIAALALQSPGVGHELVGAALSNALRNGMTDPS